MPGNNVHINRYKDLSVTKGGSALSGLVSATYGFNRNINTLFTTGNSQPVAKYGDTPDIQVSYTGYSNKVGGFDLGEANSFTNIAINGKNGGVVCDLALLASVSYNFSIDSPFTITKTFKGYSKPAGAGGSSGLDEEFHAPARQDYTGSLPAGISGNHLQKVTAEISIERQVIQEFARRKPYACVINYPIKQSITYEVFSDSLDSVTIDDLGQACKNPSSEKYNATITACGSSFTIANAYVTSINYSGGEAQRGGSPQTISITYTSYEDIPGLIPVIIFPDD